MGSKGKMMQLTYGHEPRLLPKALHDRVGEPKPAPRVAHAQDEHEMNWIEAIQGKARISCPLRVCRAAHGGHASRYRVAARRAEDAGDSKDSLRRRQYARHQ